MNQETFDALRSDLQNLTRIGLMVVAIPLAVVVCAISYLAILLLFSYDWLRGRA